MVARSIFLFLKVNGISTGSQNNTFNEELNYSKITLSSKSLSYK